MTTQEHEKNYYPASRQITEADAPAILPLWEGMVPSSLGEYDGSRILLHGPPSVGKTSFAFGMLNAIATGQDFLGRKTTMTPCLFVSLDMSKGLVFRRWIDTRFVQKKAIDFFYCRSFNCLDPMFTSSDLYSFLRAKVQEGKHGLVAIDALREVHTRSMNDDDIPHQVYEVFREWFPSCTVMFIHHTRKSKFAQNGAMIAPSDDDALGSRFWTALATVSLSLQPLNRDLIKLDVGKSQAYPMLYEPMKLFIEEQTMECKIYDEQRVAWEKQQYKKAEQACLQQYTGLGQYPLWSKLSGREQDEAMGKVLGVSPRTMRRYRHALLA